MTDTSSSVPHQETNDVGSRLRNLATIGKVLNRTARVDLYGSGGECFNVVTTNAPT